MKIKVWPLTLLLVCFWLIPAVAVIYLIFGMALKIGRMMAGNEVDKDAEKDFPNTIDFLKEAYAIATWPLHIGTTGARVVAKTFIGCLIAIAGGAGAFYYMGTSVLVPETVTNSYKSIITQPDIELSKSVKEKLSNQLEGGFVYSELIQARNEILNACPTLKASTSTIDTYLSTMKVGFFSMEASYAAGIIEAEHIRVDWHCDKPTTE